MQEKVYLRIHIDCNEILKQLTIIFSYKSTPSNGYPAMALRNLFRLKQKGHDESLSTLFNCFWYDGIARNVTFKWLSCFCTITNHVYHSAPNCFIHCCKQRNPPHTSLFFSHSSSDEDFSRSVFSKFAKINIQRYFSVVFEVSKPRFAVFSQVETITVHIDKYV